MENRLLLKHNSFTASPPSLLASHAPVSVITVSCIDYITRTIKSFFASSLITIDDLIEVTSIYKGRIYHDN